MLCFPLKFTLSSITTTTGINKLIKFRSSSFGRFLEKRKKIKDISSVGVLSISIKCQPQVQTIDSEDLKAWRLLYHALHHPSILDARRHFRYGLSPLVSETPPSGITLIVSPRCSRTVLTSTFYSTQLSSDTTYTPLNTITLAHVSKGMNAADLQVLRFLGEGTSGKVYLVRDRKSKVKLALKVIPKKDRDDYALNTIVKERNISLKLSDSPWFINMCAAWHDQLHFYMAMTVYPTDLDSEIIRCGVIDPNRARFYMAEIIIALTELHSRGIIHRDIKAPNILIDQDGHIVLADFGLSKDFHKIPSIAERVYQPYWPYFPDENPTSESEPRDPEDLHFVAWNYRGSDMEMAPEIHLRMPYSFGVDFWSASVILYWMLTGRPPFYEDEAAYEDEGEDDCKPLMYKIAEDDLYWDESDNVDEITKDFLERMMAKDPKQRLMISLDMPAHPYFAGVNWTLMEERLVTPPWIPGSKIGHVYEDISPTFFSTGETYLEGEDPFPDFSFYSKQQLPNVDMEEEECSSEAETVHATDEDDDDGSHDSSCDVISRDEHRRAVFEDEISSSSSDDDGKDDDALSHNDDCDHFDLMTTTTWDISIISPPATKPHGLGPKSWIHGLDLVKFLSSIPHAANAISLDSRPSVPWPNPELSPPIFPSSVTTTTTTTTATRCPRQKSIHHVVNGVGFMFKVKVWIWKIWNPKPKREKRDNWKRFTILS